MSRKYNSYAGYRQYRKNRRRYEFESSVLPYIIVFYLFLKYLDVLGYLVVGLLMVMIGHAVITATRSTSNSMLSDNEMVKTEVAPCKTMEGVRLIKSNLGTTEAGYINKNNQKNLGKINEAGTDHKQWFYTMGCMNCGHMYKANGSDIWQRKCPKCQGGRK